MLNVKLNYVSSHSDDNPINREFGCLLDRSFGQFR